MRGGLAWVICRVRDKVRDNVSGAGHLPRWPCHRKVARVRWPEGDDSRVWTGSPAERLPAYEPPRAPALHRLVRADPAQGASGPRDRDALVPGLAHRLPRLL